MLRAIQINLIAAVILGAASTLAMEGEDSACERKCKAQNRECWNEMKALCSPDDRACVMKLVAARDARLMAVAARCKSQRDRCRESC